ncbi:MAG: heme biosynthesis HemY N-terminal domain-containing protein [Pseudomonadota bacterium]
MWNMLFRFLVIAALAAGAVWLAERPGTLTLDWLGYSVQIPIMAALITLLAGLLLVTLLWGLARRMFHIPDALAGFLRRRNRENVQDALTKGIIAVGAGDAAEAAKYARKAGSLAAGDPLTQLLRAQAAQLKGDQSTVTRVFEAMIQSSDTEVLGLRGLFTQARQNGDMDKARLLAERALELNPGLSWALNAMLAFHSAGSDWQQVGRTLDQLRAHGIMSRDKEGRLQAVAQTAQAIEMEEREPAEALALAERALKVAPGLVPAAVLAGRLLSAEQNIRKATRLLEKAWELAPHPEIVETYAYLRSGDSPQDRQKRVKSLTGKHTGGLEGAVGLAIACIDAQDWKDARKALEPYAEQSPSVRVCELMAEIEQGEFGDKGRAREWLSRAVRAPRDPAWVAGSHVSSIWLPVSPTTGELDAFAWQVPPSGLMYAPRTPPPPPTPEPPEPPEPENVEDVQIAVEAEHEEGPGEPSEEGPDNSQDAVSSESGNSGSAEDSNLTDPASNGAAPVVSEDIGEEVPAEPASMPRPDDPGPPVSDESC